MSGAKPLTKQRSPWVERDSPELTAAIGALGLTARAFHRAVHDGWLNALVAEEPEGWHASISHESRGTGVRYPTWDELAHARHELLPLDLDFVMHLPPPGEYVAVHDTCFHLHEHPARPHGRSRADRLEAALREIARLHTEVTVETVPNECLRGICGHEDGCPDSDPVSVCDRCWELWDDGFNRDDAVPDAVRWPCETRRMLGAALEGDEG